MSFYLPQVDAIKDLGRQIAKLELERARLQFLDGLELATRIVMDAPAGELSRRELLEALDDHFDYSQPRLPFRRRIAYAIRKGEIRFKMEGPNKWRYEVTGRTYHELVRLYGGVER